MSSKSIIFAVKAKLYAAKSRFGEWLLGPVARASQLVADADACLIGLYPRPLRAAANRKSHSLTAIRLSVAG